MVYAGARMWFLLVWYSMVQRQKTGFSRILAKQETTEEPKGRFQASYIHALLLEEWQRQRGKVEPLGWQELVRAFSSKGLNNYQHQFLR